GRDLQAQKRAGSQAAYGEELYDCHRAALRKVGSARGSPVTSFRLGEFHPFEGGGKKYLYLVPSGAVFEPDDVASDVITRLRGGEASPEKLIADLTAAGYEESAAGEALKELYQARVIANGNGAQPEPIEQAPVPFPLNTLVLNVTNQCNLSCKYCYEFG